MQTDAPKKLALLLPSKGRFFDLFITMLLTPMDGNKKIKPYFLVCAHYNSFQLFLLKKLFSGRAVFIDERRLPFKGMVGAYNYAYERARDDGAEWVALWADDLMPLTPNWVDIITPILQRMNFHFGIFSSDEGNHQGYYGYNIFGGYPCAHFYVARTESLPGYFLNPAFRAYTGDNEIAIRTIKDGKTIHFLPLRVIHQPTFNSTRQVNAQSYKNDLDVLYSLHPELQGKLDGIVLSGNVRDDNCRFMPECDMPIEFDEEIDYPTYDSFIQLKSKQDLSSYFKIIWSIRRIWNEGIVLSFYRMCAIMKRKLGGVK